MAETPPRLSTSSATKSEAAYERWLRATKDPLFQQVLQGYRWERMERHLVVASSRDNDRLEVAAEIRGQIQLIDTLLAGGLDQKAQELLGLHPTKPRPPVEPLMAYEPVEET